MQEEFNHQEMNFRQRCGELCRQFRGVSSLKKISFVGAYDAVIGGHQKDSYRLTKILEYLLKSGVLIDPEFEIDVVNFREGRDFLNETSQVDLVIVSYIIAGRHYYDRLFSPHKVGSYSNLDLIDLVSSKNVEDCWLERIEEAKAKFIVTYGGNVEVRAQIFSDDYGINFTVLVPSPDEECAGSSVPLDKIIELYPDIKNIDLPIGWLGFSAEKDYLRQIAPALNNQTCLGRQAQLSLI